MIEGSVIERIRSIASEAVSNRGFEFVHIETAGTKRNPVVRIFLDKPGGITVDDCSEVSRDVEAMLDAADIVPTAYVLEVSSPGIERGLYSVGDFERFVGEQARIKTSEPVGGQSNFVGTIKSVESGNISFEDRTSGSVIIDHSLVKKANLKMDLNKELQGR